MADSFQVEGTNANAPFTLKIHRGDCMALLAMNWRNGKPPRDFVGFAIDYREPKGDRFYPLPNRLAFPGTKNTGNGFGISSRVAPIQKFRWVHFPRFGDLEGDFHYRVTAVFMNAQKELSYSEAQEAVVALRRETHPGKLNVTFTRGFISSQAFVNRFQPDGEIITLVPPHGKEGLSFKPTHKRATEAYRWMGLEAREAILEVLDEAIAKKAEVRVIAYDLNLPEILERLEKIGPRLKVIIDDSTGDGGGHKAADSPESKSATRLMKTAGKSNVVRQNMANLQHHKAIAVSAPGYQRVVYGSTNFTWRGMFVQNNNALIVQGAAAVTDFFAAFDSYFAANGAADFRKSGVAAKWHSLALQGIDADVAFSPHAEDKGLLDDIAKDIDAATSSVLFSLAFLGQIKKGEVGPAIGRAIAKKNVFCVGIADQRVGAGNLGVAVISPDGKKKIVRSESLTGKVPLPFKSEPTGLSGVKGNERGTRMHHKFVVLDFDTDKARVYLGSYNFSIPADQSNGENLVRIRDRLVATSYMIEALRIYDHYRFRVRWKESKDKGTILTLKEAPTKASDKSWWHADWQDPQRIADRRLFA